MNEDAAGSRGSGSAWRTVAAVAAIVALFALGSLLSRLLYPERPAVVYEVSGPTMGTTWTARLVAPAGATTVVAAARDSIAARLEQVNRSMSTWDPESEISRFNRSSGPDPFPVSVGFVDVVRQAELVSQATGGAFDVTVAPLVGLWGFGADGSPGQPADPAALPEVLRHVGYAKVEIVGDGRALRKTDPEVSVDLSAIAKGYGVDRAAEALATMGIAAFAVEVGGEVRALGVKPDGSPWRVGIEAPDPDARRVMRSIPLRNAAVATSGDYRNFYETDGTRYAHIVDPRTGRPVPWVGFSVTVMHPSATTADAWATGLSVLGPEAGLELARRDGLAVLFVLPDGSGGYREVASPAWEAFERGERESSQARAAIAGTRGTTAAGISWGQNGRPATNRAASPSVASM